MKKKKNGKGKGGGDGREENKKETKKRSIKKKKSGRRKGPRSGSEALADRRVKLELCVCSYVMHCIYFHSYFLLIGSSMVIRKRFLLKVTINSVLWEMYFHGIKIVMHSARPI